MFIVRKQIRSLRNIIHDVKYTLKCYDVRIIEKYQIVSEGKTNDHTDIAIGLENNYYKYKYLEKWSLKEHTVSSSMLKLEQRNRSWTCRSATEHVTCMNA